MPCPPHGIFPGSPRGRITNCLILTEEEAGFTAVAGAVAELRARGHAPVVVDGHDLCRAPEAVVAAWCEAMGLAPDPAALGWVPGMRPEWER